MKLVVGLTKFYLIFKVIACQHISYAPGDLKVRENGLILSVSSIFNNVFISY